MMRLLIYITHLINNYINHYISVGLFDVTGLGGFIGMSLGEHNRYIHCVQSTMKFQEL